MALCTLSPLAALAAGAAPSLSIVYQFKGAPDGASWAATALTAAGDGGLLGVTESGGTATDPSCDASVGPGCGTLFRLDSSGGVTVLHNFGVDKGDGKTPMSPPLADGAGNLYGTFNGGGRYGYGGIYKIDARGQQTIVHAFLGGAGDGTNPAGNLVRDAAGNIYGTTPAGGKGICRSISDVGCGTVWKVDTNGKYSLFYQFRSYEDGYRPSSLALDAEGNLVGTATFGGTDIEPDVCPHGCGVAFKITPAGKKTTLHDFTLALDGAWPQGPVVWDAAGNMHGTTHLGGPVAAAGTASNAPAKTVGTHVGGCVPRKLPVRLVRRSGRARRMMPRAGRRPVRSGGCPRSGGVPIATVHATQPAPATANGARHHRTERSRTRSRPRCTMSTTRMIAAHSGETGRLTMSNESDTVVHQHNGRGRSSREARQATPHHAANAVATSNEDAFTVPPSARTAGVRATAAAGTAYADRWYLASNQRPSPNTAPTSSAETVRIVRGDVVPSIARDGRPTRR